MTNEPNDFDHFATHIHSDELIPDGYEDRDDGEPYEDDPTIDIDGCDPEFVNWESDYYGNDADGYDGGDDFPW